MDTQSIHQSFARNGLVRSDKRILGGVCSGLAAKFDTDPWAVRLIFLLAGSVIHFLPLAYLALWVFMPDTQRVTSAHQAPTPSVTPSPYPGPAQSFPDQSAQYPAYPAQYPSDSVPTDHQVR